MTSGSGHNTRMRKVFRQGTRWSPWHWTVIAFVSFWFATQAMATVTLNGTRVLYPGEQRERVLQFLNAGAEPRIVQVWTDDGDPQATMETARSPLVVTPQIFRVDAGAGQIARLIMVEPDQVPSDRESVFYLNFSQIPALRTSDRPENRLVLLLTSRLKIFYRPPGLRGSSADLARQLRYTTSGNGVVVQNPTPFHAVVTQAQLLAAGKTFEISGVDMIPPMSSVTWPIDARLAPGTPRVLRIGLINDFGASVYTEHPLLP